MATDIATLGINIDTSGITKTADALNQLTQSAKKTQETLGGLNKTGGGGTNSASKQYEQLSRQLQVSARNAGTFKSALSEAARQILSFGNSASKTKTELVQVDANLNMVGTSATRMASAFARISNSNITSGMQRLRDTFKDTGLAINTASKQLDGLANKMQQVARQNAFKQLQQDANLSHIQIARLQAGMGDFGSAAKSVLAQVTKFKVPIAAAATAMGLFYKSTVEASMQMEKLNLAYSAVFGQRGQAQLRAIYEQSARVGLKFAETAEAAKGFFAAGQGTTLEKDMQKIFNSITGAGAALQLTTDEVNGSLLALGQMISKGKVQAEELRGQLGERLPGAFRLAAEAMGMTTAELDKFMADGKLTAEDLLPKLADALEKKYGDAALKAANTVRGSINQLETEWFRFKERIANAGPVLMITKFITQYLQEGNEQAAQAAENARLDAILKKEGFTPEQKKENLNWWMIDNSAVAEYSEQQREIIRIRERQSKLMQQYDEDEKRSADALVSKRREVITEIQKGDTAYKQTSKSDDLRKKGNKLLEDRQTLLKQISELEGKSDSASQRRVKQLKAEAEENLKWGNSALKQADELEAKANKVGKSGAGAAKAAANAQIDYKSSIDKTKESIKALEQQVNLDKTEDLTKKKIAINNQYKQSIIDINEEYKKSANKKGVSQQQALELKQLKEKEALLKKDVQLRELEEKQISKNVEKARGQISFYKDLSKLSGRYINDLDLQKTLIQAQADNYRKSLDVSEELIQEWIKFSELQISTDPFDGAYRGLIRFANEFQDQGKVWENITYDFAKSFTDQTAQMFDKFLETGELSFDGMKDLFKKLLKDLAYQAVMQPIMVNIVGGISGMFGGGSSGVAGAVAGGLMGGGSNDLIGTTTNAFFSAGGQGGGLMDMGIGLAKNYGASKLFGGEGGLIGGIADSINSAVANIFPSMFQETAGGFAGPITNAAGQVVGQSTVMPTFTSAIGTSGIGGMIGGIASPYINSLLGIENNTGSSIGTMAGGALGTIGGAMAAGSIAGPIGTVIGGVIGALGAIAGGSIGGLLGTQPKQEPKLEVDLVGSLWKPVTGQENMQMLDTGGPIAAWDPNTGAYRSAVETSRGASGAWDISRAYGNVMEQVAETSWGIADALATVSDDMKSQYLKGLEELGEINIHGIHKGSAISQENIQAFADWYVNTATGNILIALNNIDLTPLTIAADGMAADTAEELATAIGSVLSFANIGEMIEDETMKETFYKGVVDQVTHALDNVSLVPLTVAADGFAVKTVEDLTTSLNDVFAVYDVGESIQNEEVKKAYQDWAANAIVEAFKDVDLSFLRVDFDKSSFAGIQQAYAAIQAWNQVEANIAAVLDPATELTTQMKAASNEFDNWIANLKALGWQEDAITEIEGKRTDYMRKLAFSLDADLQKFLEPMPEFDLAMQQAADKFDDWISNLKRLGYSQEEIIRLEGKRTEYLLEQAKALREADLQNLTLRITALAKGSDSAAYNLQSLQFQHAGELQGMADKYGENSDIYALTKNIQALEMMKSQLDALVSERDKLFENQIAGINKQIEANNEAMKPIQAQIKANQKQAQLLQRQLKLEQKKAQELQKQIAAIDKDIAAKEREIDDRERAIEQWKDLLDDMRKFRRELWASENNLMGTRYQEAYSQFNETYERAMQGDQEAFSELQSKATDLLALGREQLETRGEYNDAFYDVDQKLKAAQEYAAKQLYEEEKQLDILKGQLDELEKQRDLLQQQLDGINAQIEKLNEQNEKLTEQNELLNDELEKIEALNEPLYAQIEELQKQQALLNEQLATEQQSNMTLGEINAGIAELQAAIAQQTAALVQQQQAIIQREQQATTNQNTMQAILQEQAKYVNSIAFGGKTDWNAQSVYDRILQDFTFEEWYDKYGKNEGGKNIPYNTTQARQNIVANKVAALNASAYQGKTNWTAQDFYDAIGGNTPENIDKWYRDSGIKEGISTIYRTTQEVTESGTKQTISSLTNNRQKINDNMDLNTSDINRTSINNTTAINEQLGWGANYLNGTMTTQLTEAYDQGVSLDALNGTQSTYWPQAISGIGGVSSSIDGLGSSLSGAINGLQGQINSLGQAVSSLQQSAASGGGGGGGSSSGNFLGKYATEAEFLDAKTSQVNSMNFGGRNDWTASQVKDAIQSAGGYDKWYKDYGKAEGFADGGITPSNRIFLTGENGPELVTSPQQWGVLSHEASQALLERERPQLANAPMNHDVASLLQFMSGNFAELISIARQSNAKLGKIEYNTDKSLSLFRNWEADGIGIAEEKAA